MGVLAPGAKEEVIRLKSELDKEVRDRRNEVSRLERRVNQREEAFDKKLDNLEMREEALNDKYREAERLENEAAEMHARQQSELERVAGMTSDEAKGVLIDRIQKDAYHDAAVMVREVEARAKEEADKRARSIISLEACSSLAYSTTGSVSVMPWLPEPELITTGMGQPFIRASEPAAAAAAARTCTGQHVPYSSSRVRPTSPP